MRTCSTHDSIQNALEQEIYQLDFAFEKRSSKSLDSELQKFFRLWEKRQMRAFGAGDSWAGSNPNLNRVKILESYFGNVLSF